jgi:hypothetical protein
MKAIFYNYQTDDERRENIFETEINVIPNIGSGITFPFNGDIHFASVVSIDHCFGLDAKFSHIDIELDTF